MNFKTGTIQRFLNEKGFGIIVSYNDILPERYFFFDHDVMSGPLPVANQTVRFVVDDRPPAPGRLPRARMIDIALRVDGQNVFVPDLKADAAKAGA